MSKSDSNLLSALQEAQEKGFTEDLFINEEGEFLTLDNEIVPPIIIEILPCYGCGATLYCVAGNGIRGTWVHQKDI